MIETRSAVIHIKLGSARVSNVYFLAGVVTGFCFVFTKTKYT